MTGGDGSVGREDAGGRHRFTRSRESHTLRYVLAQQLETKERGVTLVHVPDRRLQAEGSQRTDAADAENHLLPDTRLPVTAIEIAGQVPIGRTVLRYVRIEEDDGNPACRRAPGAGHDVPILDTDGDTQFAARVIQARRDRQVAT